MRIESLDHLVLTVHDTDATCAFYSGVLGMEIVSFGEGRKALVFGHQKSNLHQAGHEFEPKAQMPTPGSSDLCFLSETHLTEIAQELASLKIPVVEGPVARTGATGPLLSLYVRDPDGSLVEITNQAV